MMKFRSILFISFLVTNIIWINACKSARELPEDSIYNVPELKNISTQILNDTSNAGLYYQRANILHEHGDDSLALLDYELAFLYDSTNAAYASTIGDLYYSHKDISSAILWYIKALKINPDDVAANLKMANMFLILKEYNKAFAATNIILKKNPLNADAYYLKGQIYRDMGNMDKAKSSYQTCIELDPKNSDAYLKLGFILEEKEDSVCLQYYQNAFEADSNILGLYAQAMYFQNKGQYNRAKPYYQDCININPKFVHPYFNMGYIYEQQDSFAKAYDLFNLCVGIQNDYADAYYQRGYCAQKMGEIAKAKANYKQALLLDSTMTIARTALRNLP